MKSRLLSLLLVITLIAVSVSAVFPTLTMADTGSEVVLDGDIDVDMSESDPIAIVRASSSNYDYGFVSPAKGQYVYAEGDEVSFTAVPLASNNFVGWFKGEETTPVSTDPVLTYQYDSTDETTYYAKFEQGDLFVKYASAEGYSSGTSLAKAQYDEVDGNKVYKDPSSMDGWHLDTWENNGVVQWENVWITNELAHTGTQAFRFNSQYSYAGLDFTGLKKNTDYTVSFYTYLQTGTSSNQSLAKAFVVPKGTDVVWAARQSPDGSGTRGSYSVEDSLGYNPSAVTDKNAWTRVSFSFNTGDNADVTMWLYFYGDGGGYFADNFGITEGKSYSFSLSSGMGGSAVSSLENSYYVPGTEVYLSATPDEGNTFLGWYDLSGELISTEQTNFKYTITEDISIIARFEGYNMPTREYFASKGEDGTFENGTINGWYADSEEYDDSNWCSWSISDKFVSEGANALRAASRFRTSILPITGLAPNTDYKLCFDYIHPNEYNEQTSKVVHYGIISSESFVPKNAAVQYVVDSRATPAGLGWQRVEMYFNTGDATAVNFVFKYFAPDVHEDLHIDNMFLYEYASHSELANADFTDGANRWMGDGEAATDNGNGVLQLGKNDSALQLFEMELQSLYTVKFRAKGNVTAAISDINATKAEASTALTSQSIITTNSTDWQEYEIQVYSNIHPDAALVFTGIGGDSFVDDIVVTKEANSQEAIVEKFDFENGRYDVPSSVSSDAYEIYTAAEEGDANVYSGLGSLKFKYTEANSVVENIFDAAYMSIPVRKGISYKLTLKYKIAGGRLGGSFFVQPDMEGLFIGDNDSEHTANNDGWNEIIYYFTNTSDTQIIKAYLANVIYNTASDVYLDDITLSISPPVVVETNSKVAYCEEHYNKILNGNFEYTISDENWANLPTTIKIVKDKSKALKGSHYMTVSAGTKYILPVQVAPASMTYFGVSIRANSKAKGVISVADSINPVVLFNNTEEQPASYITVTNTGSEWERSAFKFSAGASGVVYLIIECTSGSFDLDSLMMFKEDYGYRYDPNDYTVYKPYDYEATKSSTVVINGGFGEQPYYVEGDGPSAETPDTGDTAALPMVMLFVTVLACSVAVLVLRKRKAGANADAR